MKLPKLPRLWYIFAHRHLCALQWAIEERGEESHYPLQEDPRSISPYFLLSHLLIFLCHLPVSLFLLSSSHELVLPSFYFSSSLFIFLSLFLSSSRVSLLSHTAVYHSLCPSHPPSPSLLSWFWSPLSLSVLPHVCAISQMSLVSGAGLQVPHRCMGTDLQTKTCTYVHLCISHVSCCAKRNIPGLNHTFRGRRTHVSNQVH